MMRPLFRSLEVLILATAVAGAVQPATAQLPVEGEVRQLVTFHFLPGRAAEALEAFRERARPLYEEDEAMLSFRALREVESPVPLDLVVVSSFLGMAGMDASNAALRALAERRGTSIGEIYGEIGARSQSHHDHFVEMLPDLTTGDPSSKRLVALIWYRAGPGERPALEALLQEWVVRFERAEGIPTTTGRFLLSDGWSLLRFVGFDSLGDYQSYWERLEGLAAYHRIEAATVLRREAVLAPVPDLSVR